MPLLAAIPFRAWASLVVAGAIAASLSIGLARWAAEPPYRPLPARVQAASSEATRVLDRDGIRWRLEDRGQVLAVEAARFSEAVELLAPRPSFTRDVGDDDEGRRLSREFTELLATTLGRAKGHVSVDVTQDGDLRRTTSLRYGRRLVRLSDRQTRERARWKDSWARGRWSRRSGAAVNGTDVNVRTTSHAAGRRRTVSVAIVLDRSVARADAGAFRSAVAAAVGGGAGRRVTVSRVDLAAAAGRSPRASALGRIPADLLRWLPWTVLALGTACFLGQVRASLLPRSGDDAQPPWLPGGEAPPTGDRASV